MADFNGDMNASYGMPLLAVLFLILLFGVLVFSLLSLLWLNSFDGVILLAIDGRAMDSGTSSAADELLLLALDGVLLRREGESAIVSHPSSVVACTKAKSRQRARTAVQRDRRSEKKLPPEKSAFGPVKWISHMYRTVIHSICRHITLSLDTPASLASLQRSQSRLGAILGAFSHLSTLRSCTHTHRQEADCDNVSITYT